MKKNNVTQPHVISLRSIIESPEFQNSKFNLPVAVGTTATGEIYTFDLAKAPHILIAGGAGDEKSMVVDAILMSLFYTKHASELKIVTLDTLQTKRPLYRTADQHFLARLPDIDEPRATGTEEAVSILHSLNTEMDNRYERLKAAHVGNVDEYNIKIVTRELNPSKEHAYMPYILVIIDDFADLVTVAGRRVEEPIARLAQISRAVGIHLTIATQHSESNIISGLIKVNFPVRIALHVPSVANSETILDVGGAEQLAEHNDMLVSTGVAKPTYVRRAHVDVSEIDRVTDFVSRQHDCHVEYGLPYRLSDSFC